MNEIQKKAIETLYENFEVMNDDYKDLPETSEASDRFWEYMKQNFSIEGKLVDIDSCMTEVAVQNEKQGFIYGFQYAVMLMAGGNICYIRDNMREGETLDHCQNILRGQGRT